MILAEAKIKSKNFQRYVHSKLRQIVVNEIDTDISASLINAMKLKFDSMLQKGECFTRQGHDKPEEYENAKMQSNVNGIPGMYKFLNCHPPLNNRKWKC